MKKLKWGLIGCGDIARKRVAPALRDLEDCELVAVNRADAARAAAFAGEFGATKWYAHWQDLVQDPEIEAVYIATPVHLHAEQAIAAAQAGKQVLCEKPMALNLDECDRMLHACDEHNVRLSVAYYRHFYPVLRRIKQMLQNGTIGRVALVQINALDTFDRRNGETRHWLLQKELAGGGPMMDIGCHRIEVLLNLFGAVSQVKALTANNVFTERDVEDTAVAVLQFETGGTAIVSVTHGSLAHRDTLDIYGEKGQLSVANLNEGKLVISVGSHQSFESLPPHSNLHLPHIEDFTRAVLDRREPQFSGKQGREVSRILSLIYGS
jgi:predicted dehydrogenase